MIGKCHGKIKMPGSLFLETIRKLNQRQQRDDVSKNAANILPSNNRLVIVNQSGNT